MFAKLARRQRDESGAVAIIVGLLTLVILMFAAYAVDIGLQVNRKHQLIDALDAAAQAGAFELPASSVAAKTQALSFAKAHDPTEDGSLAPNVDFWCITASVPAGAVYAVDTTQIPATCNPGTGGYTVGALYKSTGRKVSCSPLLCAIPCVEPVPNTATPKVACNTIRVFQGRDVPFYFAPAGGIPQGSTGNVISVACKGSCGTINPNPLDVAVIADRTLSMGTGDVSDMLAGIRGMLQEMTPSQQYVALGAIGRSAPTTTSQSGSCNSWTKGLTYPSSSGSSGKWLPISFSNDYVDGNRNLQTGSTLVKGVNCISNQSASSQGTSLAAPMKAASRYLLGWDSNNLSSLPARSMPAQKVVIFETDGQPNETENTSGSTALTSSSDIFSNREDTSGPVVQDPARSDTVADERDAYGRKTGRTQYTHYVTKTYNYVGGENACNNLLQVAANAKAQNILVIMIAYNMTGKRCSDYNPASSTTVEEKTTSSTSTKVYVTETTTKYVRSTGSEVLGVMAAAASPANGMPSTANSDCSTLAERIEENADGDYFFCAATGTDMAPIFKTALSQATKGVKLLQMP